MEHLKVSDVMLSLEDYAVVREDATILQAFRALEEAQQRLPEGHHRHRAVLVVDGEGEIVGKVGHFAFLKGLEPAYRQLGDWEAMSRAGLSGSFVRSVMDTHQLWHQDVAQLRQRVAKTTVGEIMRPVGDGVSADAPLTDAIHFFVIYQTLSLLVHEGDRVVGVLRLSDVFRRVWEFLKEEPTDPA
jgi:CBS domain-containing protein